MLQVEFFVRPINNWKKTNLNIHKKRKHFCYHVSKVFYLYRFFSFQNAVWFWNKRLGFFISHFSYPRKSCRNCLSEEKQDSLHCLNCEQTVLKDMFKFFTNDKEFSIYGRGVFETVFRHRKHSCYADRWSFPNKYMVNTKLSQKFFEFQTISYF